MRTILILGAGNGQLGLVRWAKAHGYLAAVVSPEGNYPGLQVADKCLYHDVADVDGIASDPLISSDSIAAVVSSQLDHAVLPAAKLSRRFGVPCIGEDVALAFTNKYEMRKRANACGVRVPNFTHVRNLGELRKKVRQLRFPVMIKPVDNAASRGVYRADSLEQLEELYPLSVRESRAGVIVEEFVEGSEHVVEAFTCDGRTTNLIVGHRDYFGIPGTFIPCATVFRDAASAVDPIEMRLKDANLRLVRGFGLPFGITHGEFIYNAERDEVCLVEIAARGGGVGIASDLIPGACGVDADEVYIRSALGESVPPLEMSKGAAAYFCFVLKAGTVVEISGAEDVLKIPGVTKANLSNVEVGMRVSAVRDKYSRKGPILIRSETKDGCYLVRDELRKTLFIKVQHDNVREEGIIWQ